MRPCGGFLAGALVIWTLGCPVGTTLECAEPRPLLYSNGDDGACVASELSGGYGNASCQPARCHAPADCDSGDTCILVGKRGPDMRECG